MGSVLEMVRHVRIVVVAPSAKIPDWVVPVEVPKNQAIPLRGGTNLFSEKGFFLPDSSIDDLAGFGFTLIGGHSYPASGGLRKAIFVFRNLCEEHKEDEGEETIPREEEERLLDIQNLLSGKWFVRADRNGPVGEIKEDHIVVKFQGGQGVGRNVRLPKFSIIDMDSVLPLRFRSVSA